MNEVYIVLSVISFITIAGYSWVHEIIHWITAKYLGYESHIVRKPAILTLLTSVDIDWRDKKFVVILLTPLALAPLIYITIMFVGGIVYHDYLYVVVARKSWGVEYDYINIYLLVESVAIGTTIAYTVASFGDIMYSIASLTGSEKLYKITTRIIKTISFFKNWYAVVKKGKYDVMIIDFSWRREKLYEKYKDKIVSGEYKIVKLGEM